MEASRVFKMTKEEISELLVNATETIEVDIPDDLMKQYKEHADNIGVVVEDLLSAVITEYLQDKLSQDK